MIKILFFGPVAERVGQSELALPVTPGLTLEALRATLQQRYPAAFELVCFTALNGEMARDGAQTVQAGDEVVFMSKFSGG